MAQIQAADLQYHCQQVCGRAPSSSAAINVLNTPLTTLSWMKMDLSNNGELAMTTTEEEDSLWPMTEHTQTHQVGLSTIRKRRSLALGHHSYHWRLVTGDTCAPRGTKQRRVLSLTWSLTMLGLETS